MKIIVIIICLMLLLFSFAVLCIGDYEIAIFTIQVLALILFVNIDIIEKRNDMANIQENNILVK
jgi:hypothetical protein